MRHPTRLLLCCLCTFALLVSSLPAPTIAAPVNNLTALARYTPRNSVLFIAADPAALQAGNLDAFLTKLDPTLVGLPALPMYITALLGGNALLGQSTQPTVQPWLGDAIALQVPSAASLIAASDPAVAYTNLVAIRDRAGAIGFVEAQVGATATASTGDLVGYVMVDDPASAADLLIGDEMMVIGSQAHFSTAVRILASADSLLGNPQFAAAHLALPATNYDLLGYFDAAQVGHELGTAMTTGRLFDLTTSLDTLGPVMAGVTMPDRQQLLIDIVLRRDLGASNAVIDPDFMGIAPENAALIIESADIVATVNSVIKSAAMATEIHKTQAAINIGGKTVTTADILPLAAQLKSLEGLLGRFFGDQLFFVTLQRQETSPTARTVMVDGGLVFAITNPLLTQMMMPMLTQALPTQLTSLGIEGATMTQETLDGNAALLVTIAPADPAGTPVAVYLTVYENRLVIGTRSAVLSILSPTTQFAGTTAFMTLQGQQLQGVNGIIFADVAAVNAITERADIDRIFGERAPTLTKVRDMLALFDRGVLTTTNAGEELSVARLVLALAE